MRLTDGGGAARNIEQFSCKQTTTTIESSWYGVTGAFGYGADTYPVSMPMAELSVLPAMRRADAATLIVAHGNSFRHQIADGTDRAALHVTACWR